MISLNCVKNEQLFLAAGDGLGDLEKSREFAAVLVDYSRRRPATAPDDCRSV